MIFLGFFGLFGLIGLVSLVVISGGSAQVGFFIAIIVGVILLGIVFTIPYIFAKLKYNKYYYSITNKRIVFKSGFIGYSINSIPLERISDILISKSFLENFFGFGSLHIQSLAGQATYNPYGGRWGGEATLLAVPDPEKT